MAIAASKSWKPQQLDIKSAFLYGKLDEEIYMHLPEGNRISGKVCKLNKSIYGLKQSPRQWNERLTTFLLEYGFKPTAFDPCVLVHDTKELIIAIYVDDISLWGAPGRLMDTTKQLLESEFQVTDLGDLHWLLGIKIDLTQLGITISQTAYIDKILERFGMKDCHSVTTPIDPNDHYVSVTEDERIADPSLYQQIIGSLMYTVIATRPDLAFTVTHLSQFNSCPSETHLKAAKRVLRYLKGTRDWQLNFPINTPFALEGYCDASYGNDIDTRRSFSGYLFQLGKATICWRSRKQRSVATSTPEAEYMALCLATKQHVWLQRALSELLTNEVPAALFSDNTGAIEIANKSKINDRTKHIDIQYHYVRENVLDGTVTLLHVDGKENLADICTKGVPKSRIDYLSPRIKATK